MWTNSTLPCGVYYWHNDVHFRVVCIRHVEHRITFACSQQLIIIYFHRQGWRRDSKSEGYKTWFASGASGKKLPPHFQMCRLQACKCQFWSHWNLLSGCRINKHIKSETTLGTFQLCAENQLRAIEGACCRSTSTEEVRDLSYFERMTVPQVVVAKWMADVSFVGYY